MAKRMFEFLTPIVCYKGVILFSYEEPEIFKPEEYKPVFVQKN
ncbi:MAG: hypothetical protein OXB86_04585 [Bdellovibrionales bacterium]|nr:hypothetical protein [Bdellovibrionales bacterium]